MPPNDIMGECSECGKEVPTEQLTQITYPGNRIFLCETCNIERCDHPSTKQSPQGRTYCSECGKVLDRKRDETTLGGFSA